MTSLPSSVDVAIIGAGAAGVAAARRLRDSGVSCLLIEARDRLGGRAHTIPAEGDVIDLGCEWLHSGDRNVLVPLAQKSGFVIDEDSASWSGHVGRNFPKREQKEFRAASNRFWDALEKAAQEIERDGGADRAASDFLEPASRWNPLIQTISTYYNGVELEQVSVVDLGRYEDTGLNWTARAGYGGLIAGLGANLPVVFDCAATRIDHSGRRVKIETTKGAFEADAVVVTLPTSLVARERVKFTPALPEKVEAAANLPLGLADKIFFAIDGALDLPRDGHLYGATDRIETISFDVRPRGRNFVAGFLGGAFARALEKEGAQAMESAARAQLTHMLGADAVKALRFVAATAWDLDPFAQGAYSHALPGKADARATLAASVDGRIFFAGEACSRTRFSTAHGAWETGEAAADEYLKGCR